MMADLHSLVTQEIPKGRQDLADSYTNLERVAEYCEGNYANSENRRAALDETKNFATQSLASVAYQINTLAYNFVQMLELQQQQLADMTSQITNIAQTVVIHKEKVARREIGVLTTNKATTRQFKIIAPANPERPIKYTRRPVDFSVLDNIGHSVRVFAAPQPSSGMAGHGSQSTLPRGARQMSGSLLAAGGVGGGVGGGAGPAPSTRPPTPPLAMRAVAAGSGTLSRANKEYRAPPAIAPPQVPAGASNYAVGASRRLSNSSAGGGGYSSGMQRPPSTPQVGLVQPLHHHDSAAVARHRPTGDRSAVHAQYSVNMMNNGSGGGNGVAAAMIGLNTLRLRGSVGSGGGGGARASVASLYDVERRLSRGESASPLPPPPPPELDAISVATGGGGGGSDTSSLHYGGGGAAVAATNVMTAGGGRGGGVPSWVPEHYVEKVVAVYDYTADKDDELSFAENSVIYVLKKNDDGWWEGVMDGVTGLFPGNYVEPLMS